MKVYFKLDVDAHTEQYVSEFCAYLLTSVKYEVIRNINTVKMSYHSHDVLECDWVKWTKKPKSINIFKLIRKCIDCIMIKRDKDYLCCICLNHSKKMTGTKNTVEQFARFLDKGDLHHAPTMFISSVFSKYTQEYVDELWYNFIRLKDLTNSNVESGEDNGTTV